MHRARWAGVISFTFWLFEMLKCSQKKNGRRGEEKQSTTCSKLNTAKYIKVICKRFDVFYFRTLL
jgi:hypothetical protein